MSVNHYNFRNFPSQSQPKRVTLQRTTSRLLKMPSKNITGGSSSSKFPPINSVSASKRFEPPTSFPPTTILNISLRLSLKRSSTMSPRNRLFLVFRLHLSLLVIEKLMKTQIRVRVG